MSFRFALTALIVLCLTAAPSPAEVDDAKVFIRDLLRTIDAAPAECPNEILLATRERQMLALCATFDGDFETFRSRVKLHVREQIRTRKPLRAVPETDWEFNGMSHSRIYTLRGNVIGVRFLEGELLFVIQ